MHIAKLRKKAARLWQTVTAISQQKSPNREVVESSHLISKLKTERKRLGLPTPSDTLLQQGRTSSNMLDHIPPTRPHLLILFSFINFGPQM